MPNNFYNPMGDFKPMDFSLWAHPGDKSAIREDVNNQALAPTKASPLASPSAGAVPTPEAQATSSVGGITLPAPQAAQLPGAPSGAPSSALDPLSTDVPANQSVAGKVHDKLRNVLTGDAPQGYDQILTPAEIMKARPSLSDMVFPGQQAPGAPSKWEQNLQDLIAKKQNAAGIVNNTRLAKQRADDEAKLGPMPTDPTKQREWMKEVYGMAAARGDLGRMNSLNTPMSEILKGENEEDAAKHKPVPTEWRSVGGQDVLTNKDNGAIIARIQHTLPPIRPGDPTEGQKFMAGQTNDITTSWARDSKDYATIMSGWHILQGAMKKTGIATPLAVMDAYAKITNPGLGIRPSMLEIIHNLGSLGDKMAKFWDQNKDGSLPDYIVKEFATTMYNVVMSHRPDYENAREATLVRGEQSGIPRAMLSKDLPDYEKPINPDPEGNPDQPKTAKPTATFAIPTGVDWNNFLRNR